MQNKKYLSMLGLARRAGRLAMGHDLALDSVKKNKSKLLVFASDASKRLVNELNGAAERYCKSVPYFIIDETINEIHSALGYKAGVISVLDENFANRLVELLNQEVDEYGNKN